MVRAAATGAIDFTRADPDDKWWWRKFHWTMEEVARRTDETLLQARHQHYMAMLGRDELAGALYSEMCEKADSLLEQLRGTLYPWLARTAATDDDKVAAAERELAEEFGDMNSPENQLMRAQAMEYFAELDRRAKESELADVPI